MENCIGGVHIYKEVWRPFIRERLSCARKRSNREDPFAVAMKRGTETVSHVPHRISCICTLFLRQRGSISCEVTGSSRPSVDLLPFLFRMTSSIGLSCVRAYLQHRYSILQYRISMFTVTFKYLWMAADPRKPRTLKRIR